MIQRYERRLDESTPRATTYYDLEQQVALQIQMLKEAVEKDHAQNETIASLTQQVAALRKVLVKAKPIVDLMQTATIGPEIDAALQLTSDGEKG